VVRVRGAHLPLVPCLEFRMPNSEIRILVSFVFIDIPGLFQQFSTAESREVKESSSRAIDHRSSPDSFPESRILNPGFLCFHQHSRFVPQESYQPSAISGQPSASRGVEESSRWQPSWPPTFFS